ncbi:MAG TPA: outer membrane protein assembly factor BamD [Ignavibacteria bacterium]|nr:outer membrane protein assembly factor BamD [Ignavibacteria bacterium]
MIKRNIFALQVWNKMRLLVVFVIALSLYSCSSSDKTDINTDDPQRAFSIAKRNYDKADYLQSIQDFSYIKVRFSGSQFVDDAQYYLAMSHYRREEYILAAYEFDYLLKNYPTSDLAEQARYDVAMCYYNLSPEYDLDQTYTRYAITSFQLFLELYPSSSKAPEAEAKIFALRNKLALKAFMSAEVYKKLEDYRAAVIYYDHILADYFETDYADDALYEKIVILADRSRYAEAREEIARFEDKFKNSPYYSRVQTIKNRIPLTSGK